MVKYLPTVQETWVWSLGQEDPLEKEMEAHFSTLAWKIPWTEERGGLQRVGHDWTTSLSLFLRMRSWFQWFHLFIYLCIYLINSLLCFHISVRILPSHHTGSRMLYCTLSPFLMWISFMFQSLLDDCHCGSHLLVLRLNIHELKGWLSKGRVERREWEAEKSPLF